MSAPSTRPTIFALCTGSGIVDALKIECANWKSCHAEIIVQIEDVVTNEHGDLGDLLIFGGSGWRVAGTQKAVKLLCPRCGKKYVDHLISDYNKEGKRRVRESRKQKGS